MQEKMILLNRRNFEKIVLASLATIITGCGDFYKTDFIKDNTQEIIKTREDLIKRYQEESGVDIKTHPERKEMPVLTVNPDKTYTLFYRAEFTETAALEKIVKEQIKDATVSTSPSINQLIINIKNESQISYLEELLNNSDRLPPQVLVKFSVSSDFGDKAQDYASELNMTISSLGKEFGAFTAESILPGAESRVRARASMGTKWGAEIDTDVFNMKAILDVLESHGYVKHLYQTTVLLLNNMKGGLTEEEKLPIPAYVLAGRDLVQTYNLESVKSFFEATPVIYDNGLVKLSFKAAIGSSKRPEAKVNFQVPVSDGISNDGVYLRIGQPFLVAGKVNDMEIGITRRDAMLPWPSSKDFERRKTRIWYEITPYIITQYDYSSLAKPHFKLNILESKIAQPAEQ